MPPFHVTRSFTKRLTYKLTFKRNSINKIKWEDQKISGYMQRMHFAYCQALCSENALTTTVWRYPVSSCFSLAWLFAFTKSFAKRESRSYQAKLRNWQATRTRTSRKRKSYARKRETSACKLVPMQWKYDSIPHRACVMLVYCIMVFENLRFRPSRHKRVAIIFHSAERFWKDAFQATFLTGYMWTIGQTRGKISLFKQKRKLVAWKGPKIMI